MNYKKGLKIVGEMNVAGGAGGIFGASDIGTHGGAVGNDSEAWRNSYTNVPIEYLHGSGKKKKGKKKTKIPLYRRTFSEALAHEEEEMLGCVVRSESVQYQAVIQDILEAAGANYSLDSDCIVLHGTDEYLRSFLESVESVITSEPFESGDVVALIGEMEDLHGVGEGRTLSDFKSKHDKADEYDMADFVEYFQEQLSRGMKVEMEHTNEPEAARKIALDHLWEDLEYYQKLSKIE